MQNGLYNIFKYIIYVDCSVLPLADWLILEYFGAKYGTHCGKTRRKAIFYIKCDRSADTHVSSCLHI